MEAGWSARRVARRFGRSDCVLERCWDQWIREMSFTRTAGSGSPRHSSHREYSHTVRNIRLQPTASSADIQVQVAPLLGALLYSRTVHEGTWMTDIWDFDAHYVCYP
ncbi:uncharacterized protein TNCV_1246291 [Trichonephila clavipes]|uniref:Uncharacterized protein n=1 Tax=Trichonephila clavipes TaxID=2585209 RepID=A0A8X6V2X9_TRICX|nr:uncharacterized protein TNCV_1246291 [Trichonephila clavipes]